MKKILTAAALLAASLSANAGDWEYSLTPYLWLPTISMDSATMGTAGDGGVDVGPTDYLKALDFGFMMTGEARKDKLVLKGDYIYLNFGVDGKEVRVGDRNLNIGSADASVIGKVPTLLAGLNVIETDNYHMDVLAGWRRAYLDTSIDLTRNTIDLLPGLGLIPAGARVLDLDLDHDDFLLAVNGEYNFVDSNWSVPYYADIGAGDSDLTWQVMVGVDYAFDSWKLNINYRHLAYEFGDVSAQAIGASLPLVQTRTIQDLELAFSGPSIGAKFEF